MWHCLWCDQVCLSLVVVFLGVTDLQAHQVEMTSLCARWQVQRHASAYRIVVESIQGKCIACVFAKHHMLGSFRVHLAVDDPQVLVDQNPLTESACWTVIT